MKDLKIRLAIREQNYENQLNNLMDKLDISYSNVTIEDVVNGARDESQIFIIEDSYTTILDLIEFHNTCPFNFLPVIFVTSPDSKYRTWVNKTRFSYKYFVIEKKLLPFIIKRIVKLMNLFRKSKMKDFMHEYNALFVKEFHKTGNTFRKAMQFALDNILDFLFAEKGSLMLLNEKGNLVIEASSKKELIGLEIEPKPNSVAWTVLRTRQPVFVEDVAKDNRFKKQEKKYSKDYFLSIPVFVGGEIKGVFNLSDKLVSLLFDKTDLERANIFLTMLEPEIKSYYNN